MSTGGVIAGLAVTALVLGGAYVVATHPSAPTLPPPSPFSSLKPRGRKTRANRKMTYQENPLAMAPIPEAAEIALFAVGAVAVVGSLAYAMTRPAT